MYLSRVKIDIQNRRKIKELTQIAAYHHWVEQSFPQEVARHERSRKLWRIDQLKGDSYLLIVSRDKPDLEKLCRYGVPNTAETRSYDTFLTELKEGTRCRFRIVLNPVVSVSRGAGKRGRVMPHITEAHQMKYLLDRAEKHGFHLNENEFEITERSFVRWQKDKDSIRLSRVAYEGMLVISDIKLFRELLTEGMGKKKAYGFGMMTVIPIGD